MKKIVALLLSIVLSISLVACGQAETSTSEESNKAVQNDSKAEQTESKTEEIEPVITQVTFAQPTLVDKAEYSIKFTEIIPNEDYGFTVKAQIVNKTTDKKFGFAIKDAKINTFSGRPTFSEEIEAEQTVDAGIKAKFSDFNDYDMSKITDIELTIFVTDVTEGVKAVGEEVVVLKP